LHLQGMVEVLAEVVTPVLADEERAEALDRLIEELVEPRLLHHASKRLQGLVLACLREAIRVCRLYGDDDDDDDDDDASAPPPPPPPSPQQHQHQQAAQRPARARQQEKDEPRALEVSTTTTRASISQREAEQPLSLVRRQLSCAHTRTA
jgi:hypothetical protein